MLENMDLKAVNKLGLMGGAFDPIHYGHLTAAECVRSELDLDMILFIPTGNPPHKVSKTFFEHRYLMTMLAIDDNSHFYLSRMEAERVGYSYTVDTLRILKGQTDAQLFFIAGADEIRELPNWKDYDELIKLCRFVGVTRPGYEHFDGALNIPGLDISGTELRRRVTKGQSVKYLTPPSVETYINDMNLYKFDGSGDFYEGIYNAVAAKLSQKRFKHTTSVVEAALTLSYRYGVNLRKTYLAAMLHDYAKELKEDEKRTLCKEFAIPLDDIQEKNINLMHGQLSAKLSQKEFGINDPEILDAISYHNTGRAGMSLLEKIIKVADTIEANRKSYPALEEIRTLSVSNLDRAVYTSIESGISFTQKKGHTVHPYGTAALQYLNNATSQSNKQQAHQS